MFQYITETLRLGRVLFAAVVLMLAAGCASSLSARVTTYQQWPGITVGDTYKFEAPAGKGATLEYQTFEDMVRAAIGRTGLAEAQPGTTPRFIVSFDYGNPVTQTWVQQYADPYPYMYGGFGPAFGPWGYYRGWGGGVFYSPPVQTVPVQVFKNTLTVTIRDNQQSGAEVYRSSAVNVSTSENLTMVMPYLAQAVFDGFPGNNGQVREITYDLPR